MTDPVTTQGVVAPPTLDGLVLQISADQYTVVWEEQRSVVDVLGGGRREQLLAPRPGYPEITRRCRISISWSHVRAMGPRLEARLSYPGVHQVCLWRHVLLAYRGDAVRGEFYLPPGWTSAVPTLAPPNGVSAAMFAPTVRLGFEGPLTPLTLQPTATYDSGSPPSGEAWLEIGGDRLAFGTAPGAGARILLSIVPILPMLLGTGPNPQELRDPYREPRRIDLLEGGV